MLTQLWKGNRHCRCGGGLEEFFGRRWHSSLLPVLFVLFLLNSLQQKKEWNKKVFLPPTDTTPMQAVQVKSNFWKICLYSPFLKHITFRKSQSTKHACKCFTRIKYYSTICDITYLLKWNHKSPLPLHGTITQTDNVWVWCCFLY